MACASKPCSQTTRGTILNITHVTNETMAHMADIARINRRWGTRGKGELKCSKRKHCSAHTVSAITVQCSRWSTSTSLWSSSASTITASTALRCLHAYNTHNHGHMAQRTNETCVHTDTRGLELHTEQPHNIASKKLHRDKHEPKEQYGTICIQQTTAFTSVFSLGLPSCEVKRLRWLRLIVTAILIFVSGNH